MSKGLNPLSDPYVRLDVTGHDIDDTTDNETASLKLYGHKTVSFQAVSNTGTFGTAVIRLQVSNDGVNFVDHTGDDLTAEGLIENIAISTLFARLDVQTAEGSTATADFILIAK